jgi:hypothetical protein
MNAYLFFIVNSIKGNAILCIDREDVSLFPLVNDNGRRSFRRPPPTPMSGQAITTRVINKDKIVRVEVSNLIKVPISKIFVPLLCNMVVDLPSSLYYN